MSDRRRSNDDLFVDLALALDYEHEQRTGHKNGKRTKFTLCPTCIALCNIYGELGNRQYDGFEEPSKEGQQIGASK